MYSIFMSLGVNTSAVPFRCHLYNNLVIAQAKRDPIESFPVEKGILKKNLAVMFRAVLDIDY